VFSCVPLRHACVRVPAHSPHPPAIPFPPFPSPPLRAPQQQLAGRSLDANAAYLQAWFRTKLLYVGGGRGKAVRCAWDPRTVVDKQTGGSMLHMHLAASTPSPALMRVLVNDLGVDPNGRDLLGRTPLHCLARSCVGRLGGGEPIDQYVACLVDELGADPMVTDAAGFAPAEIFTRLAMRGDAGTDATLLRVLTALNARRKAELAERARGQSAAAAAGVAWDEDGAAQHEQQQQQQADGFPLALLRSPSRAYLGGANPMTAARFASLGLPVARGGGVGGGATPSADAGHAPLLLSPPYAAAASTGAATTPSSRALAAMVSSAGAGAAAAPASASTPSTSSSAAAQHFAVLLVDRRPPHLSSLAVDTLALCPWLHASGPPATHMGVEAELARRRAALPSAPESARGRLPPTVEHRRIYSLEGTSLRDDAHLVALRFSAEPESGYCVAYAVGPFGGEGAQGRCQAFVRLWRAAGTAMQRCRVCFAACDGKGVELGAGPGKGCVGGEGEGDPMPPLELEPLLEDSRAESARLQYRCPQKGATEAEGLCEFALCAWAKLLVAGKVPTAPGADRGGAAAPATGRDATALWHEVGALAVAHRNPLRGLGSPVNPGSLFQSPQTTTTMTAAAAANAPPSTSSSSSSSIADLLAQLHVRPGMAHAVVKEYAVDEGGRLADWTESVSLAGKGDAGDKEVVGRAPGGGKEGGEGAGAGGGAPSYLPAGLGSPSRPLPTSTGTLSQGAFPRLPSFAVSSSSAAEGRGTAIAVTTAGGNGGLRSAASSSSFYGAYPSPVRRGASFVSPSRHQQQALPPGSARGDGGGREGGDEGQRPWAASHGAAPRATPGRGAGTAAAAADVAADPLAGLGDLVTSVVLSPESVEGGSSPESGGGGPGRGGGGGTAAAKGVGEIERAVRRLNLDA
jgi:hypothetical protein